MMKIDFPKSSSQEPVAWILQKIKDQANLDIFAARSWLLTAKPLFPSCFDLLFEAYKIERYEGNLHHCAALLCEMFEQFPCEPQLWEEMKSALLPETQVDAVQQRIFNNISLPLQKSILTYFAEQQSDIFLRCKLTLMLMQKNPEAVVQFGIPLAEKLVDEEKIVGSGTPLNDCRKLLVCDVLPVICENVAGVSHKHFYKWLQKAVEFYAVYFSTDPRIASDLIGKLDLSWDNLDALRQFISMQCEWEQLVEQKPTMQERMNHITDLHRKSRTDVTGKINKKQIFYTAVLLLMEGAIEYLKLLEPRLSQDDKTTSQSSHIVIFNWRTEDSEQSVRSSTFLSKLHKCFLVARNSWAILHSNEAFSKDMNHLYKRWKMEKWTWFQLFLVDDLAYEKNYVSAITKLNKLIELENSRSKSFIFFRCICQLSSLYYQSGQLFLSCKSALKCLQQVGKNPTKEKQSDLSRSVFGPSLIVTSLTLDNILPFWVHLIITSLDGVTRSLDDDRMGHLVVLCQHDWPKWQNLCRQTLDAISSKSKFIYPTFFDYMIVTDILEEVALLRNTCSTCELILLPEIPTSRQRITRGVNKTTNEEFKIAMKRQIRQNEDCPNDLLTRFLIEQQDSILSCLQSQPLQDTFEPMVVGIDYMPA